LYDFDTKQTTNLTNNPAQDIFPMWSGNKIYFTSDRDENKRLNLYSYDLSSKEMKKLTNFVDFDVKFSSLGDNAIVFENGGYIYRFDLASEKAEKVAVFINEDFAIGRSGIVDVSKSISNYEISPDGNRALFGARGEIFTVPAKYGNTRNLTNTSGVHERNSKWSPDGKWIAYIPDASGNNEVYVMPQDGSAQGTQITKNADTYKYQVVWSPDSKKIMWSDKKIRLQYVDVESKKVTPVVQATAWEITNYFWSPDSKWTAYSKPEDSSMTNIYLYSLDKKETYAVTGGWYSSFEPEFSSDGKFLFFVSDGSFNPTLSQTELDHIYSDMAKIYFVTLAKETKSPFEPKSDEVKIKEPGKESEKSDKKKDEKGETKPRAKVDVDGLQQRIAGLPVTAASYRNLTSVGDKLFYVRSGSKDEKAKFFFYDLVQSSF
jgi:tricorn protease